MVFAGSQFHPFSYCLTLLDDGSSGSHPTVEPDDYG